MIESNKVNKILYGGDYNPEQWPEEIWQEDMRLFKLANIDIVTLNVFSWAMLQPDENTYDFSKLDKIMQFVKENGLKVCLATSTAAHPAWLARKYPDILRVDANGIKRKFGGRHNSCPNSPTYRHYSVALAKKIAERYKDYDNIVAWHISNEYGGECHCDNCEKAFRVWLKKKYKTIDALNKAWNMTFWGHTLYDFDDVVIPDFRSEEFNREKTKTNFQGISLDYRRFNSESMLECYRLEYEAIKKITPNIPITTNLMGVYRHLDYQMWAKYMDFISWDNYPTYDALPYQAAFNHDLMRGLKQGKPFALMEQTPSVSNWHPYCALKRPGVMRLWSYQAVAHGSDTIMFFQMRRSIGACEKYHGAVIDHCEHENTRVFREISALGHELVELKDHILAARTNAEVGIIFDWDNWWATDLSAGPSCLIDYLKEVQTYYEYFYNHNISVDLISVDDTLDKYKLVIAPMLYMCKDQFDERLRHYVSNGGYFISTYFSGYVDENDLVAGAYPGRLKDILGIWVEEIDALPPEKVNHFTYQDKVYDAHIACDLLHLEHAQSLGNYVDDFYQGMPAVTKNQYGKGTAFYVATHSNQVFYNDFLDDVVSVLNIEPVLETPENIEVTRRENEKGSYLFILNHKDREEKVFLKEKGKDLLEGVEVTEVDIEAKDVKIIFYRK